MKPHIQENLVEILFVLTVVLLFLILLFALSKGGRRSIGPLTRYQAQLQDISQVNFEPQQLFNKSEYGVFRILEKAAHNLNAGHRVMGQTSMGEIMRAQRDTGTRRQRWQAYKASTANASTF